MDLIWSDANRTNASARALQNKELPLPHVFITRLRENVDRLTSIANPMNRGIRLVELCALVRMAVDRVFGPSATGHEEDVLVYRTQFQEVLDRESGFDRQRFGQYFTINRIVREQMERLTFHSRDYRFHLLGFAAVCDLALEQAIAQAKKAGPITPT